MIAEFEYPNSQSQQVSAPSLVVVGLQGFGVSSPIDLDHKESSLTAEVNNVAFYRMLPSELETTKPATSK